MKNGLLENAKHKNALLEKKLEQVLKRVDEVKFEIDALDLQKKQIEADIEMKNQRSNETR